MRTIHLNEQWSAKTREEREALYVGQDLWPEVGYHWYYRRGRILAEHHLKHPIRSILDVGCSSGFMTRWLLQQESLEELVGLDLSTKAIDEAKRRAKGDMRATYLAGSIFDANISRQFDVVFCCEVLEHLPEEEGEELLSILNKALRPGGFGILSTPHPDGIFGKENLESYHVTIRDQSALTEMGHRRDVAGMQFILDDDLIHMTWVK